MDKQAGDSTSILRKDLYDLVWTTPVSKLAPTMGVSDVGLAKICDRHQVPRPGRGYWAQLQHGKKVEKTPLPELQDEDLEIVLISPPGPFIAANAAPARPTPPTIVVPARLTSPHPLVAATANLLRKHRPNDHGLVSSSPGQGGLDVAVSLDGVGRCLRILNTLIKSLEERGWPVEVRGKDWTAEAFVLIADRQIPIKLKERVRREERPPTAHEKRRAERYPEWFGGPWYQHVPTGKLDMSFGLGYFATVRKNWRDGKRQRVEELLGRIMVALAQYEIEENERQKEEQEKERLRQEEARRRAEEEARVREEQARVDQLLSEVDAWHQAERIRAYVEDVQRRVRQTHGEKLSHRFHEWVGWAMTQADRADPLIQNAADCLGS